MSKAEEKKKGRDISSSGEPAELKAMDTEAGTLCARTRNPIANCIYMYILYV